VELFFLILVDVTSLTKDTEIVLKEQKKMNPGVLIWIILLYVPDADPVFQQLIWNVYDSLRCFR
jgi:hypothetical protein